MKEYNPKKFEKKLIEEWKKKGIYEPDLKKAPRPFYNLMMFPYPSAEGLHVGNVYAFVGADIYGRKKRMEDYDVFEPIGLDGFGIHTENYALRIKTHPKKLTKKSEKRFYKQLEMTGNAFSWKEKLETYGPEYYKWTQWIFIQMFKNGLAYRKKAKVNWCPRCKTVLADEQVIGGECERCSSIVEHKELEQWFFKITDYAERLLKDLENLDWSERVKIVQRNWIGKSEGAMVKFKIATNSWKKTSGETFGFRPHLTSLVLSKEKYITYRLEPKNVKVGDICEFLNRETKNKFALAKITKIEKKKMKDVSEKEEGHEKFKNRKEFYKTYEKYYEFKITDDTPIWFYHFDLIPEHIEIFTTRPDTLAGATYIVLAPENELLKNLEYRIENSGDVDKYIEKAKKETVEERRITKEKTGIELKGIRAINPLTGEEIPVWISDYVLTEYGTGAIMAVPAHDQRDFEFAKKYNLPIKMVICPHYPAKTCPILDRAYEKEGHLVDSGKFNGMSSQKAREEITKWLEREKSGRKETHYRLRDWLISRQRYWGPPIPMIYCPACAKASAGGENAGWQPVPEKDLPVLLPYIKDFKPLGKGESPLATCKEFYETKCPKCASKARRETDISDTFLDSSWYYFRYPDVKNKKEIFDKKIIKKWLPVDMYIGGAEHSVLHLLYTRFITKVFYDWGLIDFNEPFKKFRAHGLLIKDGAKMSKSRGNVVVPDKYIKEFGVDILRMYLMFLGPFEQGGGFRDEGILGIERFLKRAWRLRFKIYDSRFKNTDKQLDILIHQTIKKVSEDIENLRYNTAISQMMILLNGFEEEREISREDYEIFLKLLAPFAPLATEELWRELGYKTDIHFEKWPEYEEIKLVKKTFLLIVSINGKVRDKLEVSVGIAQKKAEELALGRPKIRQFLVGKIPKKIIFVKDRLINFVV